MSRWLREFGKSGEERAACFLESLGYHVLERGFSSRFGEVDLIAQDGETLVFVEVKARTSGLFGEPELAVGRTKQRHIAKTALAYLDAKGILDCAVRFDVIAIQGPELRHIRDAFETEGFTR